MLLYPFVLSLHVIVFVCHIYSCVIFTLPVIAVFIVSASYLILVFIFNPDFILAASWSFFFMLLILNHDT